MPPSGSIAGAWAAPFEPWLTAGSGVEGAAARRVRGAFGGDATGRGYPATAKDGIAVRRWRLRHPADAVTVSRQVADATTDRADSRSCAHRALAAAHPTMRPAAGRQPGTTSRVRFQPRC